MSEHDGRLLRWRVNALPFISYVYTQRGRVGVEWGDGFVLRAGRLYVSFKLRWFRGKRAKRA